MFLLIYLIFVAISLYSLYRIVYFDDDHGFNWIGLIFCIIGCFVPIINFFTSIGFSIVAIGNTKRWKKIEKFLESDVKLNKE